MAVLVAVYSVGAVVGQAGVATAEAMAAVATVEVLAGRMELADPVGGLVGEVPGVVVAMAPR